MIIVSALVLIMLLLAVLFYRRLRESLSRRAVCFSWCDPFHHGLRLRLL